MKADKWHALLSGEIVMTRQNQRLILYSVCVCVCVCVHIHMANVWVSETHTHANFQPAQSTEL